MMLRMSRSFYGGKLFFVNRICVEGVSKIIVDGQKYLEIKQWGFYFDIIGIEVDVVVSLYIE